MAFKVLRTPTKRLLQRSLVAAAICSLSVPAFALSLSDIKLESGLHQPFRAVIALRNFDPLEVDRVDVEIANDVIKTQYNNSNYLPAPLKARLVTTGRGTVIELTSPHAIDEPFLKFAVQLNSPDGLFLRQYEVLLDPPTSVYNLAAKVARQQSTKQPRFKALEDLRASINISESEQEQVEFAETSQQPAWTDEQALAAAEYRATIQPRTAALSDTRAVSVYAAKREKPLDFVVADSAFATSTADSVAQALFAFRERARSGKSGGLSSREIVNMSANSVYRISRGLLD